MAPSVYSRQMAVDVLTSRWLPWTGAATDADWEALYTEQSAVITADTRRLQDVLDALAIADVHPPAGLARPAARRAIRARRRSRRRRRATP